MAEMVAASGPAGFLPGTRPQRGPATSNTSPEGTPLRQDPPPVSAPGAQPAGAPNERRERAPHRDPGGLRARLEALRQQGAGSRRPLGSPEGPARLPNPNPERSSRGSSDPRRITDATAVVVRQASIWLDWALGRRFPDRDFVATAEESYNIASPLAGEILDRIPETGPLAELAERAGAVGAGVATATYLARAGFGKPGGRAESDALQERFVRRLASSKKARAEAAQHMADQAAADEAAAEAAAPVRTYAAMVGLEDTDLGIPQ